MSYVISSRRRLDQVRRLAEDVQASEPLHKLTMQAVFVLEDIHESFVRFQEEQEQTAVAGEVALSGGLKS